MPWGKSPWSDYTYNGEGYSFTLTLGKKPTLNYGGKFVRWDSVADGKVGMKAYAARFRAMAEEIEAALKEAPDALASLELPQ